MQPLRRDVGASGDFARSGSVNNERSRPRVVLPRIAAEVRELHSRVVGLEQETGRFRGRRFRRDLRDARHAEADLLRVLGYTNYDDFATASGGATGETTTDPAEPTVVDPAKDARETEERLLRILGRADREPASPTGVPTTGSVLGDAGSPAPPPRDAVDVDELYRRIGALEEEVAEARFELQRIGQAFDTRRWTNDDDSIRCDSEPEGAKLLELLDEVSSLLAGMRHERAELATLKLSAWEEAERLRSEAANEARDLLQRAQHEAMALAKEALRAIELLVRATNPACAPNRKGDEPSE